MSTTSNPYGLSFYEYKGGKNRASISAYYLPSGFATSLGQGDPINMDQLGYIKAYAQPDEPDVNGLYQIGAVDATLGQFVKVEYTNTSNQFIQSNYWPGGTTTLNGANAIVYVADLPYNIYKIQCAGSLGITSPQTAVGRNYNITAGTTPNPKTGFSTASLDVTNTVQPNFYLTAKIVGLAAPLASSTNTWYDTYADVLVILNNHPYKIGTNGTNSANE